MEVQSFWLPQTSRDFFLVAIPHSTMNVQTAKRQKTEMEEPDPKGSNEVCHFYLALRRLRLP